MSHILLASVSSMLYFDIFSRNTSTHSLLSISLYFFKSVSLLKVFTDTNYSLLVTENGTTINTQESGSLTCLKRVSSFQLYNNGYGYSGHTVNWFACGY